MIRGRKVTDPVVQGARGAGLDNNTGITRAWDTVGKAKSDLRKIEHRLEEVERHPVQLNQTGETSIVDYSLDRNRDGNNTYDLRDEFSSGAVVDNYGRSAYLKARTQQSGATATRKVSKLADKYVEEVEWTETKQRKSSMKNADSHGKSASSKQKYPTIQLQEKRYTSKQPKERGRSSGSRGVTDRRVEFSDNIGHHYNHAELSNGIQNRNNGEILPTEQSTLTDSRDIRETNIHFLNNDLTQEAPIKDYHGNSRGHDPRLTHVSVTVPGSGRQGKAPSASSGTGSRDKVVTATNQAHFLDLINNPDMDGRSLSDCSHSDSETGKGRRFRGDIRKIDPGGLAKIKETIRKQIETSSSPKESREDAMGAIGGDSRDTNTQHHLHDPNDAIQPRSQDMIEGATEKTAKVRKIAAGPAAPTYKGFSETEVKYRLADNKTLKYQEAMKRDKKRQVSIKTQDRVPSDPVTNWLYVEEGEGKSKKLTRVIAPSRKTSKPQPQPKHKEIITTSSWRAGQELVLRELGPVKTRKSSKFKDSHSDLEDSPLEERPDLIGEEYPYTSAGVGSATAAEIQHHKALSDEARRVYNDLQLSDEDDARVRTPVAEREKKWKSPTKRKAPKATESEKQKEAAIAKQRHYDAEQIRKYMQRQKADRIRRQKNEENRAKEEGEARRHAMEELLNKQKQATVVVGKKEKSSRHRPSVDPGQAQTLNDLPRHHPFHTDRVRFMVSDDSENKENIGASAQDMEISDSSSTITGDEDIADNSPNTTPRHPKSDTVVPNTKTSSNNSDVTKGSKVKSTLQSSENTNMRTVGDFSFNVTGVMSKFSQALQEKLNEEPPSLAGTYTGFNGGGESGGQSNSRADRIQAIKDTAATLQNRLKEEARKIHAHSVTGSRHTDNGATSRPSVRWNDTEVRHDREAEFMSRYDRVTAAKDDFTVFKNQLPGSQPQVRRQESANTKKPLGSASIEGVKGQVVTGNRADDIGEESTITESSTFSEITLTDESDNEEMANRKIGTGLQHRDYHAGSRPLEKATPLNIPRPSDSAAHPTSTKASSNAWEEADDFNVFSIYSRRQQDRLIRPGREPMSKKKTSLTHSEADVVPTRVAAHSSVPAYQSGRSPSPRLAGQRSEGGASSRRMESPHSHKEALRTQSPIDKSKSRQSTLSFENQYNDDEDTLEESYSQTFEMDEKSASKAKTVSEKLPPSQKSLPLSSKSAPKVPARTVSPDIEMSVSEEDSTQEDLTPGREGYRQEVRTGEPSEPARLSPNSLERRFYTELHNLESMEMSLKQLSGVDRTRAVSLAQQETVSLAQMLKAKQQGYELQLKDIQLKTKMEASEATKQLEDARKRASEAAINAADMIAKVRGEGVTQLQDSTRRLIDTQTEAAKATAEAAKFLSEARAFSLQDSGRLGADGTTGATSAQRQGARPKMTNGSRTGKRRSDEGDHDDSGSLGSADDFSLNESMTEDEREEKSFRLILPSESHRKKKHHTQSDNESVTSEASTTRMLEHEFHSLFAGREESFDKFTEEMVQQFMKEESLRAHHQASLLRLRESALLEKTKAEIQWLEQQKGQIRNKGADEKYPQIVKRQRGLKLKLQEQQAEIRRLREKNKAAAKERQKQLYEEITKRKTLQQSSQMKGKQPAARGRLGRPHEVHTEAEVSSIDEASDTERVRPKTYKSDSEIYTEPKSTTKKSKNDSRNVEKYKKIHLDEKYLTQRQSRLMDRRKNAEELLKWKQMLDYEENKVFKLEKKALKLWDKKDKENDMDVEPSQMQSVAKEESETKASISRVNGTTKATDSSIRTVVSAAQDSTVISENVSTARDESAYTSIKESVKTASDASSPNEIHRRMLNDKSNLKNPNRSGSESSIQEDVGSQSSMDESKTDDTMTASYGNETFEDTATVTGTVSAKKTSKSMMSPKSPLDKLKKLNSIPSPRVSPRALFNKSHSKNSESESEDSISHTESQSELSDFEGRIRALNEDLRRRKSEADRLKREKKKKKRELMKNKEETLKKQIEAYDNQITQLKAELQKEMANEPTAKPTVRPQIKQPRVSSPKALKQPEVTPPKHRSDTDSSGADSAQVSPVIQSEKDKSSLPKSLSTTSTTKVSLDRISEGSGESRDLSERSEVTYRTEKSDITPREKSRSVQESSESRRTEPHDDKTEDIEEEILSEHSEASDDKSKEIKIDLNTKDEDLYDVTMSHASYTEDFVATETQFDKLPLSARSQVSETEARTLPHSARSVTDQISEHISEMLPSQSASEAFIKPLDLKASQDNSYMLKTDQSERDIESDVENSYSQQESSRPSSGRSDRSVISSQTEHESSESERLPPFFGDKEEKPEQDGISKQPVRGLISSNISDINDLLGDMPEEDMTPVPSRPDTPQEAPMEKESDVEDQMPLDTLNDFDIGDRVSVTGPSGQRCTGTLLFKGNVKFASGVWAGVELELPEGRHNGTEKGVRYFKCRENHGVLVPGIDLMEAPEEAEEQVPESYDVRSSVESMASEDNDLMKLISEVDKNVQEFEESPEPSPRPSEQQRKLNKEKLTDRITDDILLSVVSNDLGKMSNIAGSRRGPPVAPKPQTKPALTNGDIVNDMDYLEDFLQPAEQEPPVDKDKNVDSTTHETVNSLMNEAFNHMMSIRNNRQNLDKDQSRDSGNFTDGVDEDHHELVRSPEDELQGVIDKEESESHQDTPLRPGSPVPGLQSHTDSHKPVEDSGNFEYDDEFWLPPNKAPPPYPGSEDSQSDIPRAEIKKLSEDVCYAVPHQTEEINGIVSSAVDEFWTQRRYGESLHDVAPSEDFFSRDESGSDLISSSRRVFKKLLFDLSGEVIRTIYKEENPDPAVSWHKPKRKRNKYYRGASPPTTVDVLKPVVQQAVVDILGLNGAKKSSEKTKWGIRKKKDLVDTILVQELREEEPEWVNYDDDELAVKMQLTETIFDNLLTDTVLTMNRIFRKKQIMQQNRTGK